MPGQNQMLDPAAMAQQRLAVSEQLRGMAQPQAAPQPAPAPPPDGLPHLLQNMGVPDIKSLIRAMLKAGITQPPMTQDINLPPDTTDVLRRAQQIPSQ